MYRPNCFTAKVSVSNFKVDKSENLDNAIGFLRFLTWHFKKTKKSRFFDFEKNVKNVFSNYAKWSTFAADRIKLITDKSRHAGSGSRHLLAALILRPTHLIFIEEFC